MKKICFYTISSASMFDDTRIKRKKVRSRTSYLRSVPHLQYRSNEAWHGKFDTNKAIQTACSNRQDQAANMKVSEQWKCFW